MTAAGSWRRASIATADQAVSSLTNAGVAVYVAATSSVGEFGLFAVCATVVQFVVAITRSSVGEPLAIRHAEDERFCAARTGAVSVALLIGVVAAALLALVGVVGPPAFLAAAVILPGITCFEALRHAEVVSGRPGAALAMDLAWLVGAVIAVPALGGGGAAWALSGWGVGAWCVAVVVVLRRRVVPSVGAVRSWHRMHGDLLWRLTAEQVLELGALQLTLVATAVLVSNAAAGALHGARLLFGPLAIAFLAAAVAGLPEASRLVVRPERLQRLVHGVSAVLACMAAGWTILLLVMPTSAGEFLLGDTWSQTRPLVIPFGVIHVSLGTIQGFRIGLRARAEAARTLRLRLLLAPLALAGGVAGAALAGPAGAAWGLAVPAAFGAVLWRSTWRSTPVTVDTTTTRPVPDGVRS